MTHSIRNSVTILLIALLISASTAQSSAQTVSCALRVLHTFSSFDIRAASGSMTPGTITLGYGIAGIANVEFSRHFALQGEIIYSSSTHTFREEDAERQISVKYLHIPILAVFNTGTSDPVNIHLEAGPQFGLNVGSAMTLSGSNLSPQGAVLAVRSTDIGIAYGIGMDVGIDPLNLLRLTLGFRGVAGLTPMGDTSGTLTPNSYYILSAASRDSYSGYIGLSLGF